MNENQKKTTEEYRSGYDQIFKKKDEIKTTRHNRGSGGVHLIAGFDIEKVLLKAKEIKDSIDPYQSPMIHGPNKNSQGEWVCEVTYYGLD